MGTGRVFACLVIVAHVAGCADSAPTAKKRIEDPMMTEAIEGQLLVDPDLSQKNMRNAAMVPAGPIDPARPLPDSVEAAKR